MFKWDKRYFSLRSEDHLEEAEQNAIQSLMLKAAVGDLRALAKKIVSLISKTIIKGRM